MKKKIETAAESKLNAIQRRKSRLKQRIFKNRWDLEENMKKRKKKMMSEQNENRWRVKNSETPSSAQHYTKGLKVRSTQTTTSATGNAIITSLNPYFLSVRWRSYVWNICYIPRELIEKVSEGAGDWMQISCRGERLRLFKPIRSRLRGCYTETKITKVLHKVNMTFPANYVMTLSWFTPEINNFLFF